MCLTGGEVVCTWAGWSGESRLNFVDDVTDQQSAPRPFTMMRLSFWSLVAAVVANGLSAPAVASEQGLKDIKHIVLFMQENRAFDHYFGTMEGVRGFQDPNVHISKNTGKDVFHQPVDQHMKSPKPPKDVTELLPWYLNYQGGCLLYTSDAADE